MGSLFGARLAESGQSVTLIDVNNAHLDAIRTHGLRLQDDRGDRHVRTLKACRPEHATEAPDLLIVFTKTMHTAAALAGVKHVLGRETHVLSLQNGLGNVEAISAFIPTERILIGMTTWPADLVQPGCVHSRGEGIARLMAADGRERPMVSEVTSAMSAAGLGCSVDGAVWSLIWEKVAFNAALNSICAVSGCTVDQLGQSADGRRLAFEVIAEVISVAQSLGIDANAERCRARVSQAMAEHVGHRPSMLQDVDAGRRTEIDAINGAVVTAAERCGMVVPCTSALAALVRLSERRAAARAEVVTELSVPLS